MAELAMPWRGKLVSERSSLAFYIFHPRQPYFQYSPLKVQGGVTERRVEPIDATGATPGTARQYKLFVFLLSG
ncbi:MAG: hypothetical protein D6814_14340 [Calditrichaeota bacterium]|nr:MAG: hypothetical protein D6814_14340 [Calditrichota bacterium]